MSKSEAEELRSDIHRKLAEIKALEYDCEQIRRTLFGQKLLFRNLWDRSEEYREALEAIRDNADVWTEQEIYTRADSVLACRPGRPCGEPDCDADDSAPRVADVE